MARIISKNRDPRINELNSNDFGLNTSTGDLFLKSNNKLFKIIARNQFNQSTTDAILNLLSSSVDTNTTGSGFSGFNTIDGFYGIVTSVPLSGSNVSLHGGIPFDYGQPLPNSPYIKSNGGFDILMDNDGGENNSSFRIFKDTGIPGLGSELLKLDNNGNLTVSGSIIISGSISGSSTIIDEHPKLNLLPNDVNGDPQVVFRNSLGEIRGHIRVGITNNTSSFMSIGADTTDPDLNPTTSMEKHLVLSSSGNVGIGLKTPMEKLVVSGNISASGQIIGTIDGGSF